MKERRETSVEYMEIMIRDIYMKTGGKGDGIKKRFLALQCLLFFGLRRVSDVNKIRGRDVEFEEDGGLGQQRSGRLHLVGGGGYGG